MENTPQLYEVPKKRMAASALILNQQNELLIVKPTYRSDWLVPGGTIETDESPRRACEREVYEEIGLLCSITRLLCIEYRPAMEGKTENIQFIFYGGVLTETMIQTISIPPQELQAFEFAGLEHAREKLHTGLGVRITYALRALWQDTVIYLENGAEIQ